MTIKSVLITGAGSGIGRALAIAYASTPSCSLYICDLDRVGIETTADHCRALGAQVSAQAADVTDAAAMAQWVASCGQLDLVVTCAGVQFRSLVGEAETPDEVRKTIAVNLIGTLNVVMPAIEVMARQPEHAKGVRGQIAMMASLGAFVTVPGASAYCASKAAVDSWAVGRSISARKQGVWLTSICPGYVRTPLTAVNGFAMHGLMEPAEAASIIKKRLESKPVRLGFPSRMVAAAKLGGLLPAGFPARMLARNYDKKKRRNAR